MSLEDSNYMHQDSPGSSIHVQYTHIIITSFYVHTLYNSFFYTVSQLYWFFVPFPL